MDVQLTEDQTLLRDSVREFLDRECPIARVREIAEGNHQERHALWSDIAALGWPGLTLPEEHGGAGLDLLDLVVVFEQAGASLLPSGLFSTVALGAPCIALAGTPQQKNKILPAVATGSVRLSLALLESSNGWGLEHLGPLASAVEGGFQLTGTKYHVFDADTADLLVIAVRTAPLETHPAGVSLLLVPADTPGVTVRPTNFLDGTRAACEVQFKDVHVPDSSLLGGLDAAADPLSRVLSHARVALCAEMTGGAQRVLDLSVAHAKAREQFGRPIGSFQAISHKCADMLVSVESCRSATYYAAWALVNAEADAETSSYLAKAYCSDAFARVASAGIQIHGGLGFTWEQDPHLYFRRAKASEHFLGDAAWNRELAARALLD